MKFIQKFRFNCRLQFKRHKNEIGCLSMSTVPYFSPDNLLSQEHRDITCKRLSQIESLRPPSEEKKSAAVLIPLCINEFNEVSLLYTKRSQQLRSHSGQVSFPGGLHDSKDENKIVTALRETEEEIGLPMEDVDIWGVMKPIGDRTGRSVTPVVGTIKKKPLLLENLCLNKEEVDSVFIKSLQELSSVQACHYTQFRVKDKTGYSLPVYEVQPYRIWGLTAIITYHFLSVFLDKQHFKHKLNFSSIKM